MFLPRGRILLISESYFSATPWHSVAVAIGPKEFSRGAGFSRSREPRKQVRVSPRSLDSSSLFGSPLDDLYGRRVAPRQLPCGYGKTYVTLGVLESESFPRGGW